MDPPATEKEDSYLSAMEKYSVDISSCFEESSEEESLLLDFLTHKKDFRVTSDEAFYNEIM